MCQFTSSVLIRAYPRNPRLRAFWLRPQAGLCFIGVQSVAASCCRRYSCQFVVESFPSKGAHELSRIRTNDAALPGRVRMVLSRVEPREFEEQRLELLEVVVFRKLWLALAEA